jgi:hypothetical protein
MCSGACPNLTQELADSSASKYLMIIGLSISFKIQFYILHSKFYLRNSFNINSIKFVLSLVFADKRSGFLSTREFEFQNLF